MSNALCERVASNQGATLATALVARDGGANGSCHTPDVSTPGSLSGDDERTCDAEGIVRDLRAPLDAEELTKEVEKSWALGALKRRVVAIYLPYSVLATTY